MISQEFIDLTQKMVELHKAKNAGYSGSNPDPWANFRHAKELGVQPSRGCLIRMSDKFARVANLLQNPANDQVHESIEDTLMDLACYSLIAICLLKEEHEKA